MDSMIVLKRAAEVAGEEKMINKERLVSNFIELAGIDSESYHERQIAELTEAKLRSLGLEVITNTTDKEYLRKHPDSFSNIYAFLKGNTRGEPIIFSAHLDTVSPGKSKKPMITDAGHIESMSDTVLGADDVSGIVSILEALETIKENDLKHPDIEILLTVAEEPFCVGSRSFDFGLIKSKIGYVLDLNGRVGTVAVKAPSITSFDIEIIGKSAHAGFAPENGINALNIAVEALGEFKTGHIDSETTLNFGTINGGEGKNIVPENIKITGEVRSFDHERAVKTVENVISVFEKKANKAGGIARCSMQEHVRAFEIDESKKVIENLKNAVSGSDINIKLIKTFGGSDANRLNEHGISTAVLACAMENVHTTKEYLEIDELQKSAELTLRLMTN